MKAEVVKQGADGKEEVADAAQAEPGDVILYTVTCTNTSSRVIREIKPVIPVPQEVEFIAGSISPEAAEGSVDARTFAPLPLQHDVKQGDGTITSEPLPEAAYRAIRWTIAELAPEQSAQVSLRARVKVTTPLPQPEAK